MLTRAGYLVAVLLLGFFVTLLFQLPQLGFLVGSPFAVLGPIQNATSASTRGIGDFFETIRDIGSLRRENERLREEVAALQGELVRLREVQRENESFREQLQLRQAQPSFQWQVARIIGRDPNALMDAIILDRGTNDGLVDGMTVMTPAGLVGQIVRVTTTTSTVLLITDVSSSVNGVLQDSRSRGVVYGMRTNFVTMRYIAQGAPVAEGEWVLTSGMGGVFPPGIPIGRIVEVRQRDIDMFQEATIQPAVDFDKLEQVLVITNHLPIRLD